MYSTPVVHNVSFARPSKYGINCEKKTGYRKLNNSKFIRHSNHSAICNSVYMSLSVRNVIHLDINGSISSCDKL